MTVYVDDMQADFKPAHRRDGARYVMSHMIADSEAELHAMADRIGVARRWYQGDHYDVTQSKRALAIRFGAKAISMRDLALMAIARRSGAAAIALEAAGDDPSALAAAVAGNPAVRAILARFPGAAIVGIRCYGA